MNQSTHPSGGPRVVVALDFEHPRQALELAGRLPVDACRLKVGKELFTRAGPALVEELVGRGFDVFLDLKFHDIPNTVAAACRAAVDLGVWMINVHASGGPAMLSAAREAVPHGGRTRLIAVTVLTSMGAEDLRAVGLDADPRAQVERLALLTRTHGLDGVVCSAREAPGLRTLCGGEFLLVTPGIRPAGSASDDQKRILTPRQALEAGSDYLVVGRPITRADDPCRALLTINEELSD